MNKDSQLQLKQRFDACIDEMMSANFFMEQAVEVLEKGMIQRALKATSQNQSEAAKVLGIHRNTLQRKMRDYQIDGKWPNRQPVGRAKAKTVRRVRKVS
jgi:DNA-binding NtrC family response regulator